MSEEFVDAEMEAAKGIEDLEVPKVEGAEDIGVNGADKVDNGVAGADNGNGQTNEPAVEPAKKPAKEPLEEPDEGLFGVKIAKEFGGVPYIGEIKGARKTKEGPLYKVLYRDGDEEEFSTDEAQTGKQKYITLQSYMWDRMVEMVEDLDVKKLTDAGIKSMSDLELFGGGAALATDSGTPFDSLDMPLKTKRQLYIIATYVLNDQMLSAESTFEDMARYNSDKMSGTLPKPRKVRSDAGKPRTKTVKKRPGRKKKTVVKAVASVKKKRGPPKKRTKTTATSSTPVAKKKRGPPKARAPPKVRSPSKARVPPRARTPSTPSGGKVTYSGPPTDSLDGVMDWPGTASEGWTFTTKERGGKPGHTDKTWTSPGGNQFRSKIEVRKFLIALQQNDGDEKEAKKSYKDVELS